MTFRMLTLTFFLAATTTAALAADPNTFTLLKSGKPVGRASYSIDPGKDSYHVKSRFEYHLPAVPSKDPSATPGIMTEAQYTNDYKVDLNGNYLSGYTQNAANQMITSFQPDKARTLITVNQAQGGIQEGGKPFPMPTTDFLVAPDYDPGALQILLTTSTAHPHANSKYTLFVPGYGPKPSNTIIYISLQPAPQPESDGTLDGKPITLKHIVMNFAKGKADLYTDSDGKLMQADMGPISASYIRAKFVLSAK